MGLLLARLLGTQSHLGVATYGALSGGIARRAVLEAVVVASLSGERLELFNAVATLYRAAAKERNRLSHDIWAVSVALPNCLLVIPQSNYLTWHSSVIRAVNHPGTSDPFPSLSYDEIQVYRLHELERLGERIINLEEYVRWFHNLFATDPNVAQIARQWLDGSHDVQQQLQRQRDHRNNTRPDTTEELPPEDELGDFAESQ